MESNKRDHKPSDKSIECDGCLASIMKIKCGVQPKCNDKACPCCKCIVKVVCNTICEELCNYISWSELKREVNI